MVSPKPTENGATGSTETCIPPGKYHVVGWDLDTTGRRLVDEICQIAAFSPSSKFSQYVMPHRDISIGAQRRHNIRVVTIGRYRMLKDSKTGKILKTKSEVSALMDFLQWLESLQGSSLDGIILINHEPFRVIAPMLLESLRRYNLLDRFSAVVKGFVNGYKVAEAKCAESVRFFPLRTLSKMLLDKDPALENAADRAELIYEIAHRLCVEDEKPDESSGNGDCAPEDSNLILVKALCKFGVTLEVEEQAIEELKLVLDRQKGLTPVFVPQLSMNLRQRQRATVLRRLLAVAGIDFATLAKNYAEAGNAGLDKVLETLSSAKPKDITDLKDMLLQYFDPTYKPPTDVKPRNNRQRKPRKGSITETSHATKTQSSPDASSASTSARSENSSPAKVQDGNEQRVVKVEVDAPKPPRSEALRTTVKQEKSEDVPAAEHSETKSIMPDLQAASQDSKPILTEFKTASSPESKPSSPESKPSSPESKPESSPESKPSSPESKPSSPESKPSSPESKPSSPESKPVFKAPESKPVFKPELSPESKPESSPESKPESSPESKPVFKPESSPESKPVFKPESSPESKPVFKPESSPESKPESSPESKPESSPESKPESSPESKPESSPESKPESSPESKPVFKPESKPVFKPESSPESKPVFKPESSPESKPVSSPESKPSPQSHSSESTSAPAEPPKISSFSSGPLQQEQSTPGSEVVVKQEPTTSDSPAS